jgi:leucyl-tRNA synthetase
VYKAGFYDGVFLVGEFKGAKVSDAKDKVRQRLIEAGDAVPYWEPMSTGRVALRRHVRRRAHRPVVRRLRAARVEGGGARLRRAVASRRTAPSCKQLLLDNVDRMHEWGCSRSFGLGTHLPADPQFLIESLSDSTIYMAYYTIAHLLQGGNVDPERVVVGPLGLKPAQCTDAFFDFVFRGVGDAVAGRAGVDAALLARLRREFHVLVPVGRAHVGPRPRLQPPAVLAVSPRRALQARALAARDQVLRVPRGRL